MAAGQTAVRPLRVLVVDDDQALLRMLGLTISTEGLEVATAEDGLAALGKLASGNFDVVVLDLQMPGMDGRAVFREMRARGDAPPVIILSAYGAEIARRQLGAAAAINKPFDPDQLLETVRAVATRDR